MRNYFLRFTCSHLILRTGFQVSHHFPLKPLSREAVRSLCPFTRNSSLGCSLRCFSTSVEKLQKITKSENDNDNKLIYYGTISGQIKGVKVFTLISSAGGIALLPYLFVNMIGSEKFSLSLAICGCMGFFTFVTPLLIHSLTKKYVIEIRYNAKTDTYTATTLSLFLRRNNLEFKVEDVTVPDLLPVFTSVKIKDRALFILSDCFIEIAHYIRIMGYDKPIDLHLGPSEDDLDKDQLDKINDIEEEKQKVKSKAV